MTAGANNLVLRVDDGAGGSTHILRVYRNHADIARVRHEVALLTALGERPLPFALPAILTTRAGTPFHLVEVGGEEEGARAPAPAVLWTYLPGSHPDPADATLAEAAGEALALLDMALAPCSAAEERDWR
jgi:Ser/Thr protein kinase RdoA (MazF antagonist)